MALSLKDSQAAADLAQHLYDFLPYSGNPAWRGHVSFKTVAEGVGLADFWQPGSKLPMLTALVQNTLQFSRGKFERFIIEVVRASIIYRQKSGSPLRPNDIDKLNGLLLAVGFRFPDLWDSEFKDSLKIDSGKRAQQHINRAADAERCKSDAISERGRQLTLLQSEFFGLEADSNRQNAGLALEKVLNRLFALNGLAPREPFRVVGEQIDGSFDLDHETYLVEAKWEKSPLPEADLLVFRGKIEGKSAFTRGVFIALNGISAEAQLAITRGKQPTFFLMDGYDLTMVLSERIGLAEFLRQRRRLLAEEGLVVVPFPELWSGSRAGTSRLAEAVV